MSDFEEHIREMEQEGETCDIVLEPPLKLVPSSDRAKAGSADCLKTLIHDIEQRNVTSVAAVWVREDGDVRVSHYGNAYQLVGMLTTVAQMIVNEKCIEDA